jgi:hypothetical protein
MVLPGEVAWYVTGRFYLASTVQDAGYFVHLQGVHGSLFAGDDVSESAAHFTFSSEPFTATTFENGALTLGLDPIGTFNVYLQRKPAGNFDDPSSFASGECIATFRRVSVVVAITVGSAVTVNTFSAKLVTSCPFEFRGRTYDFAQLVPNGITQWGTASPDAIADPPKPFTAVYPFVGSAIACGAAGS